MKEEKGEEERRANGDRKEEGRGIKERIRRKRRGVLKTGE